MDKVKLALCSKLHTYSLMLVPVVAVSTNHIIIIVWNLGDPLPHYLCPWLPPWPQCWFLGQSFFKWPLYAQPQCSSLPTRYLGAPPFGKLVICLLLSLPPYWFMLCSWGKGFLHLTFPSIMTLICALVSLAFWVSSISYYVIIATSTTSPSVFSCWTLTIPLYLGFRWS